MSDIVILTDFTPELHFHTPFKRQETKSFLDVFMGYRKKHWHEMG